MKKRKAFEEVRFASAKLQEIIDASGLNQLCVAPELFT
jgi:hypothetical protein